MTDSRSLLVTRLALIFIQLGSVVAFFGSIYANDISFLGFSNLVAAASYSTENNAIASYLISMLSLLTASLLVFVGLIASKVPFPVGKLIRMQLITAFDAWLFIVDCLLAIFLISASIFIPYSGLLAIGLIVMLIPFLGSLILFMRVVYRWENFSYVCSFFIRDLKALFELAIASDDFAQFEINLSETVRNLDTPGRLKFCELLFKAIDNAPSQRVRLLEILMSKVLSNG